MSISMRTASCMRVVGPLNCHLPLNHLLTWTTPSRGRRLANMKLDQTSSRLAVRRYASS